MFLALGTFVKCSPLPIDRTSVVCAVIGISPPFTRCRMCGHEAKTSTASAGTGQGKPKLKLAYFPKDNAKDKLVSIGGRACFVLGTVEAVFPDVSPEKSQVLLLSFYYFHQTASAKYKILHFAFSANERVIGSS